MTSAWQPEDSPTDENTSLNKLPLIKRYGIGDCQMIQHLKGNWVETRDLISLIDIITDDDSSIVMLARLNKLKEALS